MHYVVHRPIRPKTSRRTTSPLIVQALERGLGRLAPNYLFAVCLATQAFAIAWFLARPLTPQFLAIHHLPASHDWGQLGTPQPDVRPYWLLTAVSFGAALWLWRRGRRPSLWLLVAGAVVLNLLALLVTPFVSQDVYAYSFYGRAQAVFHENPYLTVPNLHRFDPWYRFWSWRSTNAVYGPLALLLLRGVAVLAGPSMLAWVIWMKLLMTAAIAGAVALLARAARADGDPCWPVLLVACNPLVLEGVAMSAHVDALLLLLAAGAILAHRHGHLLAAFGLLVGMLIVKLYFGPVVVLYALWWATRRPVGRRLRTLAGLGVVGMTLVAVAYLPFVGAGSRVLQSDLAVAQRFSSGTAPDLLRTSLAPVLGDLGGGAPAANGLSVSIARDLSLVAILVGFVAIARRLPRANEPWNGLGWYFLLYLLACPWVWFWHAIPLLAFVAIAPTGGATLAASVLSIFQLPSAAGSLPAIGPFLLTKAQVAWVVHRLGSAWRALPASAVSFLGRYAPPMLALLWIRIRRSASRSGSPG